MRAGRPRSRPRLKRQIYALWEPSCRRASSPSIASGTCRPVKTATFRCARRARASCGRRARGAAGGWRLGRRVAGAGRRTGVVRFVVPRRSAFIRKTAGDTTAGAGRRRERRRRTHRHGAPWRSELATSRAVPDAGVGERRACRSSCSRSPISAAMSMHRVAEVSIAAPGVEVIAVSAVNGDGIDSLAGTSRTRAHRRAARLVRRRQVDAREPAARRRAAANGGRSATTEGSSHDDASRARAARERRVADRHAGDARAAALDRGRWPRLGVRRCGGMAAQCRFRDCVHDQEPGCAVARSGGAGALPAERLETGIVSAVSSRISRKQDERATRRGSGDRIKRA